MVRCQSNLRSRARGPETPGDQFNDSVQRCSSGLEGFKRADVQKKKREPKMFLDVTDDYKD